MDTILLQADVSEEEILPVVIINETDNIFLKFAELGINASSIRKQLTAIGTKSNNNKIGYTRLQTNQGIVRVIVCPKIFNYDQQKYLDFLSFSFAMIEKYRGKAGLFKVDKTLLNLASIANSSKQELSFERLIEFKFVAALEQIIKFFRKFNIKRNNQTRYVASSVEFDIDVLSSVIDPNKSNIHQIKPAKDFEVKLAAVSQKVISAFLRYNKDYLSSNVSSLARQLQGEIKRKFNTSGFGATVNDLFNSRATRLFRGAANNELRDNLLVLLSTEDFFDINVGEVSSDNFISSSSVFFEPNLLFEYIVYDRLLDSYKSEEIVIKPRATQNLTSCCGDVVTEFGANPEFLVKTETSKFVVDVKWKILSSLDSKFQYDVLKLQRDAKVHSTSHAMLIYPTVDFSLTQKAPYRTEIDNHIQIHILEIPYVKTT